MEEVLPSSVADAEALAPEEIYAKKRGRDAEFLEGNSVYLLLIPGAMLPRMPFFCMMLLTFNSNQAA